MKKMHKDDWEPRDWQGKRRDQVETSALMAMLALGGLILLVVFLSIVSLTKMWMSWQ